MNSFSRYFPFAILALVLLYLVSVMGKVSRNADDFDLVAFGKLPVQANGRVKPIDTLARNSLYAINHKATFIEETTGPDGKFIEKKQPAVRWFADMLFNEELAAKHKIFRIVNDDVLSSMGLKARSGLRYAFEEMSRERLQKLFQWAGDAAQKEELLKQGTDVELTIADEQAIALANKVQTFIKIRSMNQLPNGLGELTEEKVRLWLQTIVNQSQTQGQAAPRLIPHNVDTEQHWSTIGQAAFESVAQQMKNNKGILEDLSSEKISGADFVSQTINNSADGGWLALYWQMRTDYRDNEPARFNETVEKFRANISEANASVGSRVSTESFVNRFEPFYQSTVLTVMAMFLLAGSWFGWNKPFVRAALAVAIVSVSIHTFGLFARMYLEGRPLVFVTNLYSSAVFIGWVVVLVGLFLEWIFRNSVGLTVACVVSFKSLLVAHFLDVAGSGTDNMSVMQAVLDTNFWLATHVTIVTVGYAATFIAGFLGIAYVALGIFTPVLDKDLARTLGRMTYGILCAATMLSFIGTVLGGIWADQSWGRFWGWDPKENGALNIVMWNALILHARWGGMVRQRGIAVLAILGNIVTTWSWFGTNMLGVGLHSYGKMDRAFFWMMIFMSSQLAIAAAGAFWPLKSWLSYEAMTQGPAKRKDGKRLNKLNKPAAS